MTKLNFANTFYTTPLGSFALVQAILNGKTDTEKDREHFRTLYWRLKKNRKLLNYADIRKRSTLEKFCEKLGLTLKTEGACIVISDYNILFTLYLEDEDGKPTPMPLREDGLMPITLCQGKVYTLDEWLGEFDDEQRD